MAMAQRLRWYLERTEIPYELIPHPLTESSRDAARAAHVPPEQLAKAILLEDEAGYLLVVIPASHRIDQRALRAQTGRRLELATEPELAEIFEGCALGAVPPTGAAYGIPTAIDEALRWLSDVYFEAGDHEQLVHVKGPDFARLTAGLPFASYSRPEAGAAAPVAVRERGAREQRLDEALVHVFSLRAYGGGLRRQPEYERDGHTGMILAKTAGLRVVLEAARAGTTLATHVVRGPATLYVIAGSLDVETGEGTHRVGEGEMAMLPADARRELRAVAETLFLIALSPLRATPATEPAPALRRILIVANRTVGGPHLEHAVQEHMRRAPCEFVVLSPASPSQPGLTWEERQAREEAQERLEQSCGRLRALGASVEGLVGDFYPRRAIQDLMLVEDFDEVIVSTLPQGVSQWLKLDLPSWVRRRYDLPVTHVVGS